MASLTLRSVKGTPLTNNEIDTNFTNLNTEIGTKLASADYTAADILVKIKTVDGAGSGLDADLLDGMNAATANTASTIVSRDASGNFSAGTITAALLSGDIQLQATKTISFEGSTDDAYETVLSVVDPTADRTILLPNVSGTIVTTGDTGTVTNTMLAGSIANAKLTNSSITIDGVSVSLGGTLSILNADNAWAGTQTFPDNKLILNDNVDVTKVASFQLSNITPGASRSMIIPDENGIIATQAHVTASIAALGTMSAQNSNSVNITGGSLSGVTVAGTFTGNVTGNATTATTALNSIGVGQSWQDVLGSRSTGTTYTNSTGKPIMVGIRTQGNAYITVDGIVTAYSGINNASNFLGTIVPNGSSYFLTGPAYNWAELR